MMLLSFPHTHTHTTHDITNIFASTYSEHQSNDGNDYTSIRSALDDILSKLWHHNTFDVEHDQLIRDMHSQQVDMITHTSNNCKSTNMTMQEGPSTTCRA